MATVARADGREPDRLTGLVAALTEPSADCVTILDLDGRLIATNRPGLGVLEAADPALAIGEAWTSLWPADAQAEVEQAITTARSGQVARIEACCPTATGTPGWLEVTVVPVFARDGSLDRLVSTSRDISQVRGLIDRLRDHEEFLREALEYNPHMFWVADRDGAILQANSARLRFLGRPLAEATGTGWSRYIHPDDREAYVAAGQAAAKSRSAFDLTFRLLSASGDYRWVRTRAYPKLDEAQRIQRWYGYSDDVHEQRLALEALDERKRRLRTIQNTLPECVKVVSADGRLLEMNPAGLAMIEAESLDQVKGHKVADLVVEEHRRAFVAYHRAATRGEARPPLVFEVQGLRGRRRWLESRSARLIDADGGVSSVLSVTRDVTDRREAELSLRASEERLRLVTAAAGIGHYDAGADGTAVCSSTYLDLYGLPADQRQLGFAEWLSLMHPDDRERIGGHAARVFSAGGRVDVEFRIRRADTGELRWLCNRGEVRVDADGRVERSYGAQWDITDQKAAEEELKRLQGQALQASRLNAMGAMASTLAHELNQPLAATANYVAAARLTVERGAADPDRLSEVLDLAAKEALRAGEIVRKLRSFVTRGEVATQPTPLRKLVTDAVRLAASHGEAVAPQVAISPEVPKVLADPVQIEQVLGNLLRNAIEATRGRPAPAITISARRDGPDLVRVTVKDNGPGVASESARNLFSPFASTKENGMGIGLSICRTIVEAHGGRIWHEAPPEGGTAFAFTLRRAKAGRETS